MTYLWITEFEHQNILPPLRTQSVAITPALIGFALKADTRHIRLYAESACFVCSNKRPVLYLPAGGGDTFTVPREELTGMAVRAVEETE